MGKRLFILPVLILTFGQVKIHSKTMQEYWNETDGIPIIELQYMVNNVVCRSGVDAMAPCILALNSMLLFKHNNLELIGTEQFSADKSRIKSTIEDFGELKIVKFIKPVFKSVYQRYQHEKEEKRRFINYVKNIFERRAENSIDFKKIFTFIADYTITSENMKYEIASAMNAFMSYRDPHFRFVPIIKRGDDSSGKNLPVYFGIGAILTQRKGITALNPMDDSPAQKAGLLKNDIIISVNGVKIKKLPLPKIVEMIQGPLNTSILFEIERDERRFEIPVTRGKIKKENVTSRMLHGNTINERFGYIKLDSFSLEKACSDVKDAVNKMKDNVSGFVLDLRENGGGYVHQAVCIANIFLPRNKIILGVENEQDRESSVQLTIEHNITTLPLVVLINGNTASASELLSGALQDHKRATIIGTRSFGKGVMQFYMGTRFKGIELAATSAKFYNPSGKSNHIKGIIPDIEVFIERKPSDGELYTYREEDLYYTTLEPTSAEEKELKMCGSELDFLQYCVKERGVADLKFTANATKFFPEDYQLLYAIDVLRCK